MHLEHLCWDDDTSYLLHNPRYPHTIASELVALRQALIHYPSHVCLATSGSSIPKWALLSKSAILASAASVNAFLQVAPSDLWLIPLPLFHIGGLAILARSWLSQVPCVTAVWDRWSPHQFCALIEQHKATLSSVVPTQLYDLVAQQCQAPTSLRALLVGGGSLPEALYHQGRTLGWPILPTYGMTETSSQVATAPLHSLNRLEVPCLEVLSHLHVANSEQGLAISGTSLLTAYLALQSGEVVTQDPKENGWFYTCDHATQQGNLLSNIEKNTNIVKVKGERVHLEEMEQEIAHLAGLPTYPPQICVVALPHPRDGEQLHLIVEEEPEQKWKKGLLAYHARALPFAKMTSVMCVEKIPLSPLGKIRRSELRALVSDHKRDSIRFDLSFSKTPITHAALQQFLPRID